MSSAFNDQPHASFPGKGNGMLNVMCVDSWNDKTRVSVYAARVCAVGKTGHVVVVGRHQIEGMERRVRPLARNQVAGRVVIFCERGMADCSWRFRRDKSPRYRFVQMLPGIERRPTGRVVCWFAPMGLRLRTGRREGIDQSCYQWYEEEFDKHVAI